MKFVCENCKAKYQISDDKVAGKTLRMKCRRCGTMIQVNATVTETSVSGKNPDPQVAMGFESRPSDPSLSAQPAQPNAPPASSPRPMSPPRARPPVPQSPMKTEQLRAADPLARGLPTPTPSGAGFRLPAPPPPRPSSLGAPAPPPPRQSSMGLSPNALQGEDMAAEDGATVVQQSPLYLMERGRSSHPPRIVPPARASLRGVDGRVSSVPPPPRAGLPSSGMASGGMAAVSGALLSRASVTHNTGTHAAVAAVAPLHSPSSPALLAGFQRAVVAPASSSQPLPTEDWYVGIGGVPLGPVRLSVLRDKAAQGQVDGESLVWREGFDEWLALKSFAPLLALVDEARSSRSSRTSLPAYQPTPVPGASSGFARTPSPLAASLASSSVPEAAPSLPFDLVGGRASSSDLSPSANGSRASYSGTPGSIGQTGGASGTAGIMVRDPFGAPTPAPSYASGAGLSTTAGSAIDIPLGGPTSPRIDQSAFVGQPSTTSMPPPSREKRRGVHPVAWAFIAMAACFGGVAAWAVFLRDKPAEIVYINGTAQTPGVEVANNAPPPPPTGADATSPTDPELAASGGPIAQGPGTWAPGTTKTSKPGEPAAPIDNSGFNFPGGPKGPSAEPTSGGNGGGGGKLSEGEISGVVSRNQPIIRRRCWTPAYDARSSDAPKNARVTANVSIGPSGSVKSVSTSGGSNHYPSLASCVQSSISSWQFPPSDEGGAAVIPFVFSGQ